MNDTSLVVSIGTGWSGIQRNPQNIVVNESSWSPHGMRMGLCSQASATELCLNPIWISSRPMRRIWKEAVERVSGHRRWSRILHRARLSLNYGALALYAIYMRVLYSKPQTCSSNDLDDAVFCYKPGKTLNRFKFLTYERLIRDGRRRLTGWASY